MLFLLIHFLFSHSFDDHQRSFTAAQAAEPRLTFGARQQPTYRNNNNNKPDLTNFLDQLHQLEAENNTSANNSKFFGKEKISNLKPPTHPLPRPPQQPIGSLYSLTTFVFISKLFHFGGISLSFRLTTFQVCKSVRSSLTLFFVSFE
jgi:hypothetical protein